MVPLKFSIGWDGAPYTVFVSVYSEDGTVAIAHAGIEVGQGINTKVPNGWSAKCGVMNRICKLHEPRLRILCATEYS